MAVRSHLNRPIPHICDGQLHNLPTFKGNDIALAEDNFTGDDGKLEPDLGRRLHQGLSWLGNSLNVFGVSFCQVGLPMSEIKKQRKENRLKTTVAFIESADGP